MSDLPACVYTDGGVIGPNPSPQGGVWAYCWIDHQGQRSHRASGLVRPRGIGLPTVTNNVTELLAVLLALEGLPDDWSGIVHTDSFVTLSRFRRDRNSTSFKGIPESLVKRTLRVRRKGQYGMRLVAGHPTSAELARGCKGNTPTSPHNVWCDRECGRRIAQFRQCGFCPGLNADDAGGVQTCVAAQMACAPLDCPA